jgi:hypothetical protein
LGAAIAADSGLAAPIGPLAINANITIAAAMTPPALSLLVAENPLTCCGLMVPLPFIPGTLLFDTFDRSFKVVELIRGG